MIAALFYLIIYLNYKLYKRYNYILFHIYLTSEVIGDIVSSGSQAAAPTFTNVFYMLSLKDVYPRNLAQVLHYPEVSRSSRPVAPPPPPPAPCGPGCQCIFTIPQHSLIIDYCVPSRETPNNFETVFKTFTEITSKHPLVVPFRCLVWFGLVG